MTWVVVAILAALAFVAGAALLRRERGLWTLFAAALVFGLAGFAWQASPAIPAAPGKSTRDPADSDAQMTAMRRAFFAETDPRSRYVLTADAFARGGELDYAAGMLRNAIDENPKDGEAWLALAIVLVEHADGRLGPPAILAFQHARDLLPGNPGPAYFMGIAALREGRFEDTYALWRQGLASARPDAPGRALVARRVGQLQQMMAQMPSQPSALDPGQSGQP